MSTWTSLRPILPALLALSLTHCSCQHQPEASPPHGPEVSVDAQAPVFAAGGGEPTDTATDMGASERSPGGAGAAVATLHAYLGALPGSDRTRADAYWSGSGPGKPADDSVLRQLPDLRAMRIESGRSLPLDQEQPARAWEVPVQLRLDTASGPFRLHGWYRLRARVDGHGWEITSARLDPVID